MVRAFGKFRGLRRIIMSLTACAVPMASAMSLLVIFISLCETAFPSDPHIACRMQLAWQGPPVLFTITWLGDARCAQARHVVLITEAATLVHTPPSRI